MYLDSGDIMTQLSLSSIQSQLADPLACLEVVTIKHTFTLNPRFIGDADAGIKEKLRSWSLLYNDKFDGVPISFRSVQRLQTGGSIVEDQPHLHIPVQLEAIVFRPKPEKHLRAVVNKIGRDHIGCLVHHHFNASLPKPRQNNTEFNIADSLTFEVFKVYTHNGVLSIRGTLPQAGSGESSLPSSITVNTQLTDDDTPVITSEKKRKKKKKNHDKIKEEPVSSNNQTENDSASKRGVSESSSNNASANVQSRTKRKRRSSINSMDSGIGFLSPSEGVKTLDSPEEEVASPTKKMKKKHGPVNVGL